jgi:signal transduction histidine kinase/ActR/RegA family two-component response regulator
MVVHWLVRNRVTAGFGLALVILVAVSVDSYQNLLSFRRSASAVEHTFEVKNAIGDLFSRLQDAETAQRGYLITGDNQYLAPYQAALKAIEPDLQKLRDLTRDNIRQQQQLDQLQPIIDAKLTELQQTVALRQVQQTDAALQILKTGQGKRLMDQIRQSVAAMQAEENRLLTQRSAVSQADAQSTTWIIVLGSLLASGLVALAALVLNRDLQERNQMADELRLLNETLEVRVSDRTKELENADRLKDEFLSVISHELRTPLHAILGWTRLLQTGNLAETKITHGLEVIERNAKSQAQLIEDLLDVSRIITGKLRLAVRPISLIPVIEAAIDTVRPAAEARSIQIQSLFDPNADRVSGDPERLQQVIWNLVSNAIKFTPKGGRIQVRLERINSHIEIIVSDTGKGISAEFLPYLFNRFSQEDGSSTRSQGGLGLGLSIVRNIIELHGGSVQATSPGEGQGTTFVVSLPLMIVHRPIEAPDRVHPIAETSVPFDSSPSSLQGLKILAVDDETDSREMLTEVLQVCGASVTAVGSAHEALEALKRLKPDILLSDIGMPDEDGYSLIRQIRALDATQGGQTIAIALTAYARTEDRIRALETGFQMHIAKPIEPAELVAVIKSFSGRKK